MKSKLYIFIILIAFLTQAVVTAQTKLPGIKGSWDSDLRSRSGIGTIWTFKENGTLEITSAAMIDYIYVLFNDTLITVYTDKQTAEPQTDTSVVKIKNDTLTQVIASGGKQYKRVLKRNGKISDPNNIERGFWEGKNSANQKMTYKFTKDHQLIFRVPFETKKGTYELNGTSLKINVTGEKPEMWNVHFVNNTMILKNGSTGSEIAFERSR